MTKLPESVDCWGSGAFEQTLKTEIENLESGVLPLEKGGMRGGAIDDSDISVTVIKVADNGHSIEAKIGVFFHEITAGGSCGDDPMLENAYCVLQASIEKSTGEAQFTVISE